MGSWYGLAQSHHNTQNLLYNVKKMFLKSFLLVLKLYTYNQKLKITKYEFLFNYCFMVFFFNSLFKKIQNS